MSETWPGVCKPDRWIEPYFATPTPNPMGKRPTTFVPRLTRLAILDAGARMRRAARVEGRVRLGPARVIKPALVEIKGRSAWAGFVWAPIIGQINGRRAAAIRAGGA